MWNYSGVLNGFWINECWPQVSVIGKANTVKPHVDNKYHLRCMHQVQSILLVRVLTVFYILDSLDSKMFFVTFHFKAHVKKWQIENKLKWNKIIDYLKLCSMMLGNVRSLRTVPKKKNKTWHACNVISLNFLQIREQTFSLGLDSVTT